MALIPLSIQLSLALSSAQANQHVSFGAPCPLPSAVVLAFTYAYSTFVYTVHSSLRYFLPGPVTHAARTSGRYKCMCRMGHLCPPPHLHITWARAALFACSPRGPPMQPQRPPFSLMLGKLARTVHTQSPQSPSHSFAFCSPTVTTAHLLAAPFSFTLPVHPLVWLACDIRTDQHFCLLHVLVLIALPPIALHHSHSPYLGCSSTHHRTPRLLYTSTCLTRAPALSPHSHISPLLLLTIATLHSAHGATAAPVLVLWKGMFLIRVRVPEGEGRGSHFDPYPPTTTFTFFVLCDWHRPTRLQSTCGKRARRIRKPQPVREKQEDVT
ncbi:hypothetical protein B0H14DRAFT_3462741 [Mycena olivaceomarginata]|nr:hypothetical protein B0H14DRAFT_3462741 [Mycena olivaceomarginata]